MRDKALAALKRWGEIAGASLVLWGLIVGFVHLTGGTIPPWYPAASAAEMRQSLCNLTVTVLSLQRSQAAQDRRDAKDDLSAHPDMKTAQRDYDAADMQVRRLDEQIARTNCAGGP